MILKNIFENKIDRTIEGVIKADDRLRLRVEVEEYVLTREVEDRLKNFLDAYNDYETANGVWISGFFGSGKSHLLKMLAFLLENHDVNGQKVLDLFLPKCEHNKLLAAGLEKAAKIPSTSILFNIDQKSNHINAGSADALLAVFVKVFDEMCGFYGNDGHVAQFERDLDHESLLVTFKEEYEKIAKKDWTEGREQSILETTNIDKAYAKVSGKVLSGIIDKYRKDYKVSIESFVEMVHKFIMRQPKNFRLNFFVDEVGQYILGHPNLMINLQTIAETLNTKCRGQAWIIVTAQDDMETIVGQIDKRQSNDFSRIQDRFKIRMKLTSKDVAEVIQKRLLKKNKQGEDLLSDIYHVESNNFGTLFNFKEGTRTYRNFNDKEHFIYCYPFIPYQFELFQSAIMQLSGHDAFEGRQRSVGERSMLAVFQQVVKQIADCSLGQLATFDRMFDGIRDSLKTGIKQSLISAERQLDDDFEKRLLKTLLLVKYISKDFKTTSYNLSILMIENFNQDISALQKIVQEALNHLEQQIYIQRNGELYEYLTNEEKDVEHAIQNTEIENDEITSILSREVFRGIVGDNTKINCNINNQPFPFAKKLDDTLQGPDRELCINVCTPFGETLEASLIEQHPLVSKNSGHDELLILMPTDNNRLVQDLALYRKTEKYYQQNYTQAQNDGVKNILQARREQNASRLTAIQGQIRDLLSRADLYVKGNKLEISEKEPQKRVQEACQTLIARVYTHRAMLLQGKELQGKDYSEQEAIAQLKKVDDPQLAGTADSLLESEKEIFNAINGDQAKGVLSTLKKIIEKFEKKPYGWSRNAILFQLAKLITKGKIEATKDSNILEGKELENALRNTQQSEKVIMKPMVEYAQKDVAALKNFFKNFFPDKQCPNDAKAMGESVVEEIKILLTKIDGYMALSSRYPCVELLQPVYERVQQLKNKPARWFFQEFTDEKRNTLLEEKDSLLDPIDQFLEEGSKRRKMFDDIHAFVKEQEHNFSQIETGYDVDSLLAILKDKECFRGNALQQAKANVEIVRNKIATRKHEELEDIKSRLANMQEKLRSLKGYAEKPADETFVALCEALDTEKMIANIRNRFLRFEETEYAALLRRFTETGDDSVCTSTTPFVLFRNIKIQCGKLYLESESDVDYFIESLRGTLLTEIKQGKKVQL